jgi:PadR family transcriptional regulator PadR
LLSVLLQQRTQWQYGYELSKATGLTSGTLYPLLMRLSDQGFLDSQWEPPDTPGRPPRHTYRLNARGITLAQEAQNSLAQPTGSRKSVVPV